MKKFYFDLDGVVVDFESEFLSFINNKLNIPVKVENPSEYNLDKRYNQNNSDVSFWFRKYLENYQEGDLLTGVKYVIDNLKSKGYTIGFITSSPESILGIRRTVMEQRLGISNIIDSKTKYDVINSLKIDYFVDDNDQIVKDIHEKCKNCKVFFKDNGYLLNKDFKHNPTIKNIIEVLDHLD